MKKYEDKIQDSLKNLVDPNVGLTSSQKINQK